MKTLQVQFQGTARHYSYLYTGNREVRPGDWAVVHSNGAFSVVSIKAVRAGVAKEVTKPVIGIITQDDFTAYQEGIKNINDYRAKFEEMDYLIAESKRLDKYREAAKENPKVAELLREVEAMSGLDILPAPTPTPAPAATDHATGDRG